MLVACLALIRTDEVGTLRKCGRKGAVACQVEVAVRSRAEIAKMHVFGRNVVR